MPKLIFPYKLSFRYFFFYSTLLTKIQRIKPQLSQTYQQVCFFTSLFIGLIAEYFITL